MLDYQKFKVVKPRDGGLAKMFCTKHKNEIDWTNPSVSTHGAALMFLLICKNGCLIGEWDNKTIADKEIDEAIEKATSSATFSSRSLTQT